MGENGPQYFAEYSLWNDSAYSGFFKHSFNRIEFTRPAAGSIFLSPTENEEEKERELSPHRLVVTVQPQPRVRSSPGFERYIRKAFKVVTKEDLRRDPEFFPKDSESDDSDSSLDRIQKQQLYTSPPRPRWRTPQQVNGRGRGRKKMNLMQQRLEQALNQPAKIERGANMMQRMGWSGGCLGRTGCGIMEPIAPNPYYVKMLNAAYAHTTAGLGLAQDSSGDSSDSEEVAKQQQQKTKKKELAIPQGKKTKKQKRQDFITNVLQYIREFVKNDLQVEMFFEPKLNPLDRALIHQTVAKLMGEESDGDVEFDTTAMAHLEEDIKHRNNYNLGTISKGEHPHRQICIYKEATACMYVVGPEDIRPGDEHDETNPFLLSITRHLKTDSERSEYSVLDRMIDYFVEFCSEDAYTEFRFLGAFTIEEIDIMSAFFGMITCLIEKSLYLELPARLVAAVERAHEYELCGDNNGYILIVKLIKDNKENAEETDEKK